MGTRKMPPGPSVPVPVQTAIWSRQARRFLYACQDRYGDVFTLKVLRETWVKGNRTKYLSERETGPEGIHIETKFSFSIDLRVAHDAVGFSKSGHRNPIGADSELSIRVRYFNSSD